MKVEFVLGDPKGKLQVKNSWLENGVMISESALKELGKDGFIKCCDLSTGFGG